MDYAMRSGILAAETVVEAKASGDFSVGKLADYRKKLDASYIMKDINGFQDAVHVLHDPIMQHKVPNILCDFGRSFFSIDNEPTAKSKDMILDAVRRHSSIWEMAKFGFKAGRSL
jgi:electron transfer flavoprotein-quinone oxidoreductase